MRKMAPHLQWEETSLGWLNTDGLTTKKNIRQFRSDSVCQTRAFDQPHPQCPGTFPRAHSGAWDPTPRLRELSSTSCPMARILTDVLLDHLSPEQFLFGSFLFTRYILWFIIKRTPLPILSSFFALVQTSDLHTQPLWCFPGEEHTAAGPLTPACGPGAAAHSVTLSLT